MTDRVKALIEQAMALGTEDQVVLLNVLQDLVAPPATGWEAAWIRECDDRLSAFDRGETRAADLDAVISDLRKKFGRG